jgi:hypothetical protein
MATTRCAPPPASSCPARPAQGEIYSLLVQGAQSRRTGDALLASDPADGSAWLVFYFDTHPPSGSATGRRQRSESFGLLEEAEKLEIDRFANDLLHTWPDLEHTRFDGGPPLRDYCIDTDLQKRLVTYLLNLKIAEKLSDRYPIGRIHLGRGGGINELAWRDFAERTGLPLEALERDAVPSTYERMLFQRPPPQAIATGMLRKAKERGVDVLLRGWRGRRALTRTVQRARGRRLIFCTSSLINQIYARQIEASNRESAVQIFPADVKAFRSIRGAFGSRARQAFHRRWLELSAATGECAMPGFAYAGQDLRRWLLDCFEPFFRERYPHAQHRLDRAVEVLARLEPVAVLNDTQPGTEEGFWGLAAKRLGIPVYSYTYDMWPWPRTRWSPDYVLVNSRYLRVRTLEQGFDESQLIGVRSHRELDVVRLDREQIRAARVQWRLPMAGSIVLCADTWYVGNTAQQDPAISYRFYRAICSLAEKNPGTIFLVKFHPFRGRKKTKRSSIIFDQRELDRRSAFIKQLSPPENVRLLAVDVPLPALLGFVDLVLNIDSTVALQAMGAGLPVLHLNTESELEFMYPRLQDFRARHSAEDVQGFVDLASRFLSDDALRNALVDHQWRYLEEYYWEYRTDMISAVVQHVESAQSVSR